jgi:hypothetical protein
LFTRADKLRQRREGLAHPESEALIFPEGSTQKSEG